MGLRNELFLTALVSVRQQSRIAGKYRYRHTYLSSYLRSQVDSEGDRKIYFKEMAHRIVRSGPSKVCRVGQQAGDPKEMMLQFKFKGRLLTDSFPLREVSLVFIHTSN